MQAASPHRVWRWAIAGALTGTIVAVVLFAPAAWLAGAVSRASGGQVLLSEPRGTVWDGSARLVLSGGADSRDAAALPGRVNWRLRPRSTGAGLRVHADCCTPRAVPLSLRLRRGGLLVQVGNGTTHWPAGVLAGLGTPWNTLEVQGRLALTTEGLSVEWAEGRLSLAGRAELVGENISSRLSTLRPMGSYRITLLAGAAPRLRLETLEGSLQLTGTGEWIGSRLRFRGEASAAPEREAALANLLNIIGRRVGSRTIISLG